MSKTARLVKPYTTTNAELTAASRIPRLQAQKLLGIDSSAKIAKGASRNVATGIIYMCPAESIYDEYKNFRASYPDWADEVWHEAWGLPKPTTRMNVCPFAGSCKFPCLFESGRADPGANSSTVDRVRSGRIWKTLLFFKGGGSYRGGPGPEFTSMLTAETHKLAGSRDKKVAGKQKSMRLNGTSDFPYENYPFIRRLMSEYAGLIQFYDYTKNHNRVYDWIQAGRPIRGDMHLTYSMGAQSDLKHIVPILQGGGNVAMVWQNEDLMEQAVREGVHCVTVNYPNVGNKTFSLGKTYPVINGKTHDARFLDEDDKRKIRLKGWSGKTDGAVIGLSAVGSTLMLDLHPKRRFFQHRVNPGRKGPRIIAVNTRRRNTTAAGPTVSQSDACEVPRSNPTATAGSVLRKRLADMNVAMEVALARRISRATGETWRVWSKWTNSKVISAIQRSRLVEPITRNNLSEDFADYLSGISWGRGR